MEKRGDQDEQHAVEKKRRSEQATRGGKKEGIRISNTRRKKVAIGISNRWLKKNNQDKQDVVEKEAIGINNTWWKKRGDQNKQDTNDKKRRLG